MKTLDYRLQDNLSLQRERQLEGFKAVVLRSRKVSSVSVVRKVMREFEKCILATIENRWGREEQGWISLKGFGFIF